MSQSQAAPAVFEVGRAQVRITPPLGVSLAGYFHDRRARTLRDDLFAHAVVIGCGDERVALVSCDLATMTREVSDAAKTRIQNEVDIPADHVLVCATHTHTGPEVRRNGVVPVNAEWLEALPERIAEVVIAAARAPQPATLRLGTCRVEGYSWNRLFRLKDGTEMFGKSRNPDAVIQEAGPVDAEMLTLSAVSEDGRLLAVLVNFPLHPDVIGGGRADFVSADWPGIMCSTLQKVYGEDAVALFLQGAAGDINHVPHEPTHLPVSGPGRAGLIGRGLAGAAMTALERAEPMTDARIGAMVRHLDIPYYTRDAELAAEVDAIRRKNERTPFEQYLLERFDSWPFDGKTADVPVQTLRIGSAGIVGLPAEIFTAIGLEIKRFSPVAGTLIVELANDRVSTYIPTGDQARRGAYGAKPILSRWLDADAARRITDASIAMLWELFETR